MTRIFLAALLLLASPAFGADLPTPSLTPGAVNPAVTQQNIAATICKPGYSKSVRPPVSYTNAIKRKLLATVTDKNPRHYELDHLESIEIGGSPTSRQNLWLQSYITQPWNARVKDRLENYLHREVCAGRLPLAQAQAEISHDWVAAYRKYLGEPLVAKNR